MTYILYFDTTDNLNACLCTYKIKKDKCNNVQLLYERLLYNYALVIIYVK